MTQQDPHADGDSAGRHGTEGADGGAVRVAITATDPERYPLSTVMPDYAVAGDAGADLITTASVVLGPGERTVVGTGVAIALPAGFAGFVHPRSGLAARAGLSIVNTPGTIDAGYRGEIRVCLINHDPVEPLQLHAGDRIAQLVVQRVSQVQFEPVDRLPCSERGGGGYGSTGGHWSVDNHDEQQTTG